MSFFLKDYGFKLAEKTAWFKYENNGIVFTEKFRFNSVTENYNEEVLERALFLAFVLIGTSYFKTFQSHDVVLEKGEINEWQAKFFNSVYQEGLSQFAFENKLTREDLGHFIPNGQPKGSVAYQPTDEKPLVLQSGGKDSLLLAEILTNREMVFNPVYVSNSSTHPDVLNNIAGDLMTIHRQLDNDALKQAQEKGGLNGHVPVTYIVFAIALIQAVLLGKDTVLAAIGHEGEEPYGQIGDLPVMHQWAKTWSAEQNISEYVKKYISPNVKIGSPLRKYSELKIAELFVENCWRKYSHKFSSCNIGNYKQGQDNQTLGWCGNCAKCANSFLLFAPFVEPADLIEVFNGENLFKKESLTETFKGLLQVDNAVKLFECVGETEELRLAYHMAHEKSDEYILAFEVPESNFDYQKEYPMQEWAGSFNR